MRRLRAGVMAGLLLAASCGVSSESVEVLGSDPGAAAASGQFEVTPRRAVAAGGLVAEDPPGSAGPLTLVSVSADSVSLSWGDSFAQGAIWLRLRWRAASGSDWPVMPGPQDAFVDLPSTARSHVVSDLDPGTRYEFRLEAIGEPVRVDEAAFETLWSPVAGLSVDAFAHDAVRLSWDRPSDWVPVRYVARWRRGSAGAFEGRQYLAPGARSAVVTGLLGGGSYEFEVAALTATGWQSTPATIGAVMPPAPSGVAKGHKTPAGGDGIVTDPLGPALETPLRLTASAPAHCFGSERSRADVPWVRRDGRWVQDEPHTVSVRYQVTGGHGPYEVHVGKTKATGASGAVKVLCGRDGIEVRYLTAEHVDIVAPGTKVITVQAKDAAGAQVTRTLAVEVIEDGRWAGPNEDGLEMVSGGTYITDGTYLEVPDGDTIAYAGRKISSELVEGLVYFPFFRTTDGIEHSGAWIQTDHQSMWGPVAAEEWGEWWSMDFTREVTDEETAWWNNFLESLRYTPFHPDDIRSSHRDPLAAASPGAGGLRGAVTAPCLDRSGTSVDLTEAQRWRPYGHLPSGAVADNGLLCDAWVLVHPNVLAGDSIWVCVEGPVSDAEAGHPPGLFMSSLETAVDDWNDALGPNRGKPGTESLEGLDFDVFKLDDTDPSCSADAVKDKTGNDIVSIEDERGCVKTASCPNAHAAIRQGALEEIPHITSNRVTVYGNYGDEDAAKKGLPHAFRHELGHVLGLADYEYGCWRLTDAHGHVHASVMSYGKTASETTGGCRSDKIELRDLADLHSIYHPAEIPDLGLSVDRPSNPRRAMLEWGVSGLTPAAYNSGWLGVFRRDAFTRDPVTGAPAGPSGWSMAERLPPEAEEHRFGKLADVAGREFTVAGLTRGDHRRRTSGRGTLGLKHNLVDLRGEDGVVRDWSVGEAEEAVSDVAPFGVHALGFDGFGEVHFGDDSAGGWLFSVFGRATTIGGVRLGAGDLMISHRPRNSSETSPFTPARFVAVRMRYGTAYLDVESCAKAFTHDGSFRCHVPASLSLDASKVPLRMIVSTAAGETEDSAMAGNHELRNDRAFVNYGATASDRWRFAFWGASVTGLKVTHGGPVSLRRGDIVISHARPFADFTDSPFIGNRFPPMRIQYGSQQITIGRLTCVHHFYNGDRYECLIRNRFTWDAANHPTEITISRAAVTEHHEPQWYDLTAQTLVTDQPRWERDGSTPAPGKRITWSPADTPAGAATTPAPVTTIPPERP